MKPAAEKFAEALEQTAIELPTIPVIQNVNAELLPMLLNYVRL